MTVKINKLHQTYPTGRKHCSACGRWRLLVDFSVRRWDDPIERNEPVVMQSLCHVCQARKRRGDGIPPRKFGYNRAKADKIEWQRIKNDPVRLARDREYHRIWSQAKRRERGIPEAPNKGPKVRLVATASGAAIRYFKPSEDGKRLVVNEVREIKARSRAD